MNLEKEAMMIQTLFEAREMCEDGMHGTTAGGPDGSLAPKYNGLRGLRYRAMKAVGNGF